MSSPDPIAQVPAAPRSLPRGELRSRPVTGREVLLRDGESIVSRTDLRGIITYINGYFCEISGYTEAELIGQPHNVIRHPDMPPEAFADLWSHLKRGLPWVGMVKNRCKNGDHYWVQAHVTPLLDADGKATGYMSVRRKPSREQVAEAERDYAALRAGRLKHAEIRNGRVVQVPFWERWNPLWKLNLTVRLFLLALFGPGLAGLLLWRQGGGAGTDLWLLAAGLAFALYSAWWLSRDVVGRSNAARRALREMASDVFTGQIDVSRNDEIGRVLLGIKSMQIRLGFQVEEMRREGARTRRVSEALEVAAASVLVTDAEGSVVFANRALREGFAAAAPVLADSLPGFRVAQVVGADVTGFHPDPSHWRGLLPALRAPHAETLVLGPYTFDVGITPVLDDGGRAIGHVFEWKDRTADLAIEREIAQVVEDAVRGELDRRIDEAGKRGFHLQLARNLNAMLDGLDAAIAEIQQVLQALADGDLTRQVRARLQGAFGRMADSANHTVARLAAMVGEIRDAVAAISAAAGEIAAGNADLSMRTEQQAASLEETASSMEELTSTVKQNADNARQANQLAIGAAGVAESGGEVVQKVVSTMGDIQTASRRIADIIGVIDGIAFQTNILALNAAVEAARAGEQGRGFAVVAAEVRSLAQRSAGAAKEIKQLITDSVLKVEEGSALVDQAGKTMGEIVSSVKRVTDIMADISAASQEQSSGIEQVNQAITQMDEGTQQNAALVEEASAAAQGLAQQARGLDEQVARFRLR
ncbi:methyl-accepting chemotaxis protein [Thermomonas haemolytica]|uniref:Methyl-accepting chemotaxis sensory transducer with Pas/Pac sensor n=1 Tax=Thermomonas haemolytica TaxID=141949 RepID=A0A4R3NBQ0_9GAMM|nr:methyl-accepting chemotaxis protein [Thermomonas haemolytica]TCT26131.1 methyl-accepting chemotaxis sensory transducer with Pas/Pac sensor [Thermomonas haemolytica]TNY29309.1 hypothetical protein BV505_05760 [Thermomonas haemolytica]